MTAKRFWTTAGSCLLALAALAAAVLCGWSVRTELENKYILRVELQGEQECVLEYGTAYTEPGAAAQFYGTHRHTQAAAVPVAIEGTVDPFSLGTHVLKYTAIYGDHVGTAYRYVHIVDTQAPVITLVADPEKFTFPNETYAEEGFTAMDSCDGDITALVQRTETREAVTYTVTDSSGNSTTVQRQIVYDDPIPPVLELKGEQRISLKVGQTYREPGYTATDNCDGDLTGQVSVAGHVDTRRAGNYTLIYTVKDAYNNLVSVSRIVSVRKPAAPLVNQPNVVVPDGKVIYLTFDDGPGARTPYLLDVLKKYNVKATFFVVKTKYIDTIKRIADEGHSLAIHTTTHKFDQIYASEEAYFNDLYTMQGIIKSLTGQEPTLLRFPGGSSNTISSKYNKGIMTRLTQLVQEKGFRYFDWNVDSKDAGGAKTANQVFNNVKKGVSGKQISVVLQHDIKSFSVDAVEKIIVWGLENGYTFLPLEQDSPVCAHNVKN